MNREHPNKRVPGRQRATESSSDHRPVPGRRTLTEGLVVQHRKAATAPGAGGNQTHTAQAPLTPGLQPAPATPTAPGSGEALPAVLRRDMEQAFSADFADVRVHHGSHVSGVGALAYAQGNELHFAPGAYDPASQSGRELIGHELTHVMQQRTGAVSAPQGNGLAINSDPALEAEADRLGAAAARGEPVRVAGELNRVNLAGGAPPIQRMPIDKIIPKTWYNVQNFEAPLYLFSKEPIKKDFIFLEDPKDWQNVHYVEGEAQVLSYHTRALPELKKQFKVLPHLDKQEFDSQVKQLGAVGYAHEITRMGEYDRAAGFKQSVYTAEMDTCITVGFTAQSPTLRINAILHSLDVGPDVVPDIFSQLTQMLKDIEAQLGKCSDILYYVAGGNAHDDSQAKATEILQHLMLNDLPVMGIALPTDSHEGKLMKGVLITQEGKALYTTYLPPEAPSQKTLAQDMEFLDDEGSGGFTSASKMGGFTSASKMGGFTSASKMGGFTSASKMGGFTSASKMGGSTSHKNADDK